MSDIKSIVRDAIQRRRAYIPGKPLEEVQREYSLSDVIKMASNENPLGPSPLAVQAIQQEASRAFRYPESTAPALRQALGARYAIDPQSIVLDNGQDAIIALVTMTVVEPGDEVIMPAISFPSFENATVNMAGTPVKVPLTATWDMDIDGMIAAITPRTKLIFVCNPNNPTGLIITRRDWQRLLAATPDTTLLVADEAYIDYVDDPDYPDTLADLPAHPNLLILRTFSKAYGLAGLRIGYAIGHAELIAFMARARPVFAVNRIAQAAALAALQDTAFVQRGVALNAQGRQQWYDALDRMGLKYLPSQTNFILIDTGQPAAAVAEAMLRQGVIIRPQPPILPNMIRISVGTPEQNATAIQALQGALAP